jgi:hypothetical protein
MIVVQDLVVGIVTPYDCSLSEGWSTMDNGLQTTKLCRATHIITSELKDPRSSFPEKEVPFCSFVDASGFWTSMISKGDGHRLGQIAL